MECLFGGFFDVLFVLGNGSGYRFSRGEEVLIFFRVGRGDV